MRSEAVLRQAEEDWRGMIYDLEPDSRRMLITFAAFPGAGVVRPFMFFNMLKEVDVKAAFVRDHVTAWYHRGVQGIGDNIDAVADYLRDFARRADETLTIGASSGGYGAILFGALVGLEVHAFVPQTFIDPELRRRHRDPRFREQFESLGVDMDMRYADLRPVVEKSKSSINIYYSAGHRLDALHAERLGDLDNVTLHPFDWDSHLLMRELYDRGWLAPFLADLARSPS